MCQVDQLYIFYIFKTTSYVKSVLYKISFEKIKWVNSLNDINKIVRLLLI